MNPIARDLLDWYDVNKRQMPWRDIDDAYATWVSEIMLQQTQVATVKGYFTRFMDSFPTVFDLARASMDDVLKHWEGLGYYSRARNLKKGAEQVVALHGGVLPRDEKALLAISGIGPYTAGAILSIAYQLPFAAVDGNVIRVLSRIDGIREDVTHKHIISRIHDRAKALIPKDRAGDFNQALMDLGAGVCVPGTPNCDQCPLKSHCDAFAHGDQDELPQKTQARPPKQMQVGIALVTCEKSILVTKREERMLSGLYVFILDEQSNDAEDVARMLKLKGIDCQYIKALGEAKHVFTHRVWHMTMHHFIAASPALISGCRYVTRDELQALAFPTAMKAARALALDLIS